jgi:hypothetical protein
MARTKNQARVGRALSAQRSTAINDGEGSRVGTTTVRAEEGDEASNASSNERARRATRRGEAVLQETSVATMEDA